MAARKPKVVLYWTLPVTAAFMFKGEATPTKYGDPAVNWRLVGANGEVMCQSTQGFRDKTDAMRSVRAVMYLLAYGAPDDGTQEIGVRITGPGRKPNA